MAKDLSRGAPLNSTAFDKCVRHLKANPQFLEVCARVLFLLVGLLATVCCDPHSTGPASDASGVTDPLPQAVDVGDSIKHICAFYLHAPAPYREQYESWTMT